MSLDLILKIWLINIREFQRGSTQDLLSLHKAYTTQSLLNTIQFTKNLSKTHEIHNKKIFSNFTKILPKNHKMFLGHISKTFL